MEYLIDWFRYRFWGSGLGILVVLMLVVASVLAFFLQLDEERKTQPGIPVVATITKLSIGPGSKYAPGRMEGVVAQDEDGVIGRESVPPPFLAGCDVGDKIKAKRVGAVLILQPGPCR